MTDFTGLRPKTYSYVAGDNDEIKSKKAQKIVA